MSNRHLFIMICIAALMSLTAGCAILGGGSGDPAADDTQSAVNTDPSDSSDNPFSVPADDTSIDNGSGDDSTVVDTSKDTDNDKTPADKVSIAGDAEASIAVGGSLNALFTASPADTGLSYTWDVQGKPDWIIKAEDGSSNQRMTLTTIDAIPFDAAGKSFPMTIKATEAGGKAASFAFTVSVAAIDLPDIYVLPDACGEPLSFSIKSVKTSDGTLDCVNKYDCHDLQGDLDSDREITFDIKGGKAPYFVTVTSGVENSFHCRRKDAAGNPLDYQREDSYFFADKESECKDEYDHPLPSAVTTNHSWGSGDKDLDLDGEALLPFFTGSTMKNTFTIKGRLRYEGPLPISRLPKADNGYDDARKYKPVEIVTVTVKDSCEPKAAETEDQASTIKMMPLELLKINIVYPEEDKIDGLKFRMAALGDIYAGTMESIDSVKVYFADETIYTSPYDGDPYDSVNILAAVSISNFEVNYVDDNMEGYTWQLPPDKSFEGYYVTDAKQVTLGSGYDTGRDELRNITDIAAVFDGRCVGNVNGCQTGTFPVKWLRLESRYWRAQWQNSEGPLDFADADHNLLFIKNLMGDDLNLPTYLNSIEPSGDAQDGTTQTELETTLFQRREVPEYRD